MIRADITKELKALRQRVAELEALEAEHKPVEQNNVDSERLYCLLAENVTDVIWKVNIDSPTQLNYISPSVTHLLGYTVTEAMSKTMEEIFSPASFKEAMKALADEIVYLDREQIDQLRSRTLELELKHKDGSLVIVEVNYTLIRGNDRRPVEILAVARDITERRQTEVKLRQSEMKYLTLVEKGNDGVVIIQDGLIKFANYRITAITSSPLEELIGRSFVDTLSPKYRTFVVNNHKKRIMGERVAGRYEIEILSKEGRNIPVEIYASAIEYEGKPADMVFIRDITERKKAEEDLQESEKKYRLIVENSQDIIFTLNSVGEFRYVSPSVKQWLGYNQTDLIGVPFRSLVHPEDWYIIEDAVRRGNEAGNQTTGGNQYRFRHASGEWRWHVSKGTRMLDTGGKLFNFIGIASDITDRKRTEEKLEQAAQEWRATFDSITDLISIHDKDNRLVRVNKAVADLLKTTPQELIGKFCHELMHGTKEPPADCPHLLALKTGGPVSINTFNPNLVIHLQESSSPLFNEKGEVKGTVMVTRDMTQQKRIEEQLIMTDRLASIGELSSGIAHELNNPLTSVIGFSQLLMESDIPDDIKEDLGTVCSEAQRAAAIVKNLLTFARKHAPVKQLSQVNTVIEDVLRLRAYEQKVNNIEIENHLDPNVPEIMIDHFQMQQVFLNIIVNAEFAMLEAHHQGKLIITTEKTDGVIKITFADDGPGIDKENLKHIFDPFFTTKEVGKGTGLGLSICHGIVTEHGGKIYAMSEKDQGATFGVELPINEQ